MLELLEQSFDVTNALSNMYLWLLFAFLSTMINCDLQRFMQQSQLARHLVALVAFFFLFTLIDVNNKASVAATWLKTIGVYLIFVLATKSKWYFAVPVLALLLIDQSVKKHKSYLESRGSNNDSDPRSDHLDQASKIINYAIIGLIVLGCLDYMRLQMAEYGSRFSFGSFFLGTARCKQRAI